MASKILVILIESETKLDKGEMHFKTSNWVTNKPRENSYLSIRINLGNLTNKLHTLRRTSLQ